MWFDFRLNWHPLFFFFVFFGRGVLLKHLKATLVLDATCSYVKRSCAAKSLHLLSLGLLVEDKSLHYGYDSPINSELGQTEAVVTA